MSEKDIYKNMKLDKLLLFVCSIRLIFSLLPFIQMFSAYWLLFVSFFLVTIVRGQMWLTISTGTTREIAQSSECTNIGTISVNGGTLIVRASCTISRDLISQNNGRVEVYPGVTFQSTRAYIRDSSVVFVRGTFDTPAIVVETSGTLELSQGSTVLSLSNLSILTEGRFISYGHSVNLSLITVNDASYLCQSRCLVTATRATLASSNFLANAVSSRHQDCESQHSTTIASGGNHAGCSGEHSCCPMSVLRPIGSVFYPREMGYKGGTCTDDGAGLGGGSWEISFDAFNSLSGSNNIFANGGVPNISKTGIGGGGSGGSIILYMPCGNAYENAFRLQANGGDAISDSAQPAFGGSAGRISLKCRANNIRYRDFSQLFTAYGGLNAKANGWGAAGTLIIPNVESTWNFIILHIYEKISYYSQTPVPYYPATFVPLHANEVDLYSTGFLTRTETRSDVFFYSHEAINSVRIVEAVTTGVVFGAIVNGSPSTLPFSFDAYYSRPPKPKTPSQPGVCLDYYKGFNPVLASVTVYPSPILSTSPSNSNTPSATRTRSSTGTSTKTGTSSHTSTSTFTPTSTPTSTTTLTATSTPTTTNTRTATPTTTTTLTATPTPTGGPCHTTGAIRVTAGWTCNYLVPVTLTKVEVLSGGSLTFRAGLTADTIIAESPMLFEVYNTNISANDLQMTSATLTVGSGLTVTINSNVDLKSSAIRSLGTLHLVANGSLIVDSASTISAVGAGSSTPTNAQGGDSRGTAGLGGVHAGCFGTDCALRRSNTVKAYGDALNPSLAGVSGTGTGGGKGGGTLTITCGTMSVSGSIDVSGAAGTSTGGGGSGGSVKITANNVSTSSTPKLLARGGDVVNAGAHPGSGGRIALYLQTTGQYSMMQAEARYSVRGGLYTNGDRGSPGTYYVNAGTGNTFLTTSSDGTLRDFATVFVLHDTVLSLSTLRTAPNTEILFSTLFVGNGCSTAQVQAQIGTVITTEGGYVSTSPCVTMVAYAYNNLGSYPVAALVSATVANQKFVQDYFSAHFPLSSWNSVKTSMVASNTALQSRVSDVQTQLPMYDAALRQCQDSCEFELYVRPKGPVQGGQTVLYRIVATKTKDSTVTVAEAEKAVDKMILYLSSQLLYPRASFVLQSYEVRGSSLIVLYQVTIPTSGSKAGECLESNLLWNIA